MLLGQPRTHTMTEDELRSLFKPNKYGFCRVKDASGTEVKVWFDTVVKVMAYIGENEGNG